MNVHIAFRALPRRTLRVMGMALPLLIAVFLLFPAFYASAATPDTQQTFDAVEPTADLHAMETPTANAESTSSVPDDPTPSDAETPPASDTPEPVDTDDAIEEPAATPISQSDGLIALFGSAPQLEGHSGERITLRLPLVVKRAAFIDQTRSLQQIRIEPVVSNDVALWPFTEAKLDYTRRIPSLALGEQVDVIYEFQIDRRAAAGEHTLSFTLSYTDVRGEPDEALTITETGSTTLTCTLNVLPLPASTGMEARPSPLVLENYETPAVKPGEAVTIRLPLSNQGEALRDIRLAPDISSNPEVFPFAIPEGNLSIEIDSMRAGEIVHAEFDLTVAAGLQPGTKAFQFTALFDEDGVTRESKFTASIEVLPLDEPAQPTPAPSSTPVPDTSAPTPDISTAFLTFEYTLADQHAIAGEPFQLAIELANPSPDMDLEDVLIVWRADDLPASDPDAPSENLISIGKVAAGTRVRESIVGPIERAIATRSYRLTVMVSYRTLDGQLFENEHQVLIPVRQPLDVAIDKLAIESDAVDVSAPFAVDFVISNHGDTPIYNVNVDIEGNALVLEEGYYRDSIGSGEQNQVALRLVAAEEGDQQAALLINFEDEYGSQYTTRQDVSIAVSSSRISPTLPESIVDPEIPDVEAPPTDTPLYIGIGAVLAIGAGAFWIRRMRKKQA